MQKKGTNPSTSANRPLALARPTASCITSCALLAHHLVFFCVSRPIPGQLCTFLASFSNVGCASTAVDGWPLTQAGRGWLAGVLGPPGRISSEWAAQMARRVQRTRIMSTAIQRSLRRGPLTCGWGAKAPLAAGRGAGSTTLHQSACRLCCRQFATASGIGHSRYARWYWAHQQKLAASGVAGREPACMQAEVRCSWGSNRAHSP